MLTCCNLTYDAKGVRFRGLGISLLPGSLLAVHGQKGKTAFLNLMAGFKRPPAGEITFEGKPVRGFFGRNKEYASLSFHLPQFPLEGNNGFRIDSDWTVEKTVLHLAGIHAEPLLLLAALRYFGLDAVRGATLRTLNKALYGRVKLAPLLLAPRPIWLLDEPDTALDEEGREMLYRLISDRCNQDGIVIMTSRFRGTIAPCAALELEDFA